MTARLISPVQAAARLVTRLTKDWSTAVCAEARGESYSFDVPLRPNVTSGAVVERLLISSWGDWRSEWRNAGIGEDGGSGPWVESAVISVAGQRVQAPRWLRVPDLSSAEVALEILKAGPCEVDLARVRGIADRLHAAGALRSRGAFKKVCAFSTADLKALDQVIEWLAEHPDVSRWTARQLPIPRVDAKWLDRHITVIDALTGRDLNAELRQRPTVVHLTYVDPDYRAKGLRVHDAWSAGDQHGLAYLPHTVVVVENRDCRLFFPEVEGTVVIEGGGAAATALVAEIPWVRAAERVVYWGDMDADGYAILDRFRAAIGKTESILMDAATMSRYEHFGVDLGKDGKPLGHSSNHLMELTDNEREGYARIATSGRPEFRRIEQEKLPIDEAVSALSS